ncbi:MAG: protein translocase subunit SecD [Actinomycetota bacterium]
MGRRRRSLLVLLLVLGLTAASAIVIASKPTVLGLDLRGGTQLIYQGEETARTPEIGADEIDRAIEIIRERADKLGVSEPEISRLGEKGIQVGLPNVQNAQQAIDQIGTTSQLYFYDFEANVVPPPGQGLPKDPAAEADPNPNIYSFPNLYDAVQFASERKPECVEDQCTTNGPAHYLFERSSHQLLAGPAAQREDLFLQFRNERQPPGSQIIAVPQGTVVVQAESEDPTLSQSPSEVSATPHYVLRDRPALSGDDITNPEQSSDQTTSQPNVTFDFTDRGRTAFQDVTRAIAQRGAATAPVGAGVNPATAEQYSQHFSVVLDGQVVTQPIINFAENPDGIDGRTGAQISGDFTISSAQDLAEFLRIGALPINLQLESQSTVSATLGQQALDQGLRAGIVGLILVVCFLIAYYRLLGVISTVGLAVYGVIFFALMKLIPVTLTLPGIAGLILTIGVAADANVVIFERIKEEARAGRSMLSAIGQGYRKGIATIVDANVITLFTAFILFVLATAGVKGFAFTLGVGTIVSLLTAVLFTQAILGSLGRSRILRSPRALGAGPQRVRWNFDFSGASRWFFSISGVILAIGAISLATKQLNLGIDFTSGAKVTASLQQEASVDDVRTALTDANVTNASSAEIQTVENPKLGSNVIEIQGKIPVDEVNGSVRDALEQGFGLRGGSDGFNSQSVGPTFGAQVARSAVIAIVFSLLVISAYVAIRFEAKYAIPVIIALIHDILITGGVYSLTGREATSGTVAAFLTILGYSMYDTVIVFDRIRENVPRMPRAAFSQIANKSMSEVLTRSLITGLSTVFLITVLFIFGGATLKDFAFAMGVGVLSGTYSSIFIATPVLTHWKEREPAYRTRRARLIEEMGRVPILPEENVVAKVGPDGEPAPAAAPARGETAPSRAGTPRPVEPEPVEPVEPVEAAPQSPATRGDGAEAGDEAPGPEPLATGAPGEPTTPARREGQRKRRQQQRRRRKHGRNR